MAEREFAQRGFAGASLRRIGEQAGVSQAVIHYHFGSKEGLFQEIFLHRGRAIADERTTRVLRLRRERRKLTVEEIVRTFLQPAIDMKRDPDGAAFIRLQARMHTEPEEIGNVLRRQVFDVSTRLYVDALAEVLPQIPKPTLYFRMIFSVGAYLYAISDAHRLDEVSQGASDARDFDRLLDELVTYLGAGFSVPVRKSPPAARGHRSR